MRRNLAVLLLSLGALSAHGAALRVPQNYATINAALDAAVSGDSVLVAPGTYSDYEVRVLQGGGPFTASSIAFLRGGVSLIGEGGREVTRIDLASQGIGFAIPVLAYDAVPGTILVQGFTITGAPTGNAGMWSRFLDEMVVRGCRFQGLDVAASDLGALNGESGGLTLYDTEFVGCRASTGRRSAAIAHVEGDVLLQGCRFVDCQGPLIVDLDALGVSPPFDAVVRNCEFRSNVGLAAQITNFVNLTVEDCAFVGNEASTNISALVVNGGGEGGGPYVVRRNLFARNESPDGAATVYWDRVSGVFEQNTLVGNGADGLAINYGPQHTLTIQRNVFASTMGSVAASFLGTGVPPPVSACNDFWNNPGGDTEGYPPGPTDIFLDPQLCDEPGGDYTLSSTSPCLPPNSGACGQVGAFGQGCGAVAIEAETWARTKAKYWADRQPPASAR